MEEVDFAYIGVHGLTIYRSCFQRYFTARSKVWQAERSTIAYKTERIFFFLVEQGNKNGYNIDAILEIPDNTGTTCFQAAAQFSYNICNYIITRNIKVHSINTGMMVPDLQISPDLTVTMMKKGINPYVISYDGTDRIHYRPSSFESEEAKALLAKMPRSVHFSIEDIECEESCSANCPSKFKRFYYKNGPLVEMTEKNRIGKGGFGLVFRQLFHGKPMAMKCTLVRELADQEKWLYKVHTAVNYLEKNISELRIQIATAGSGIIVPVAFVRQQNQEKDQDGKWIAKNYNIFIYPLYDCNLYELHTNYFDQFTEEIVADIIHQCFIRIGSSKISQG